MTCLAFSLLLVGCPHRGTRPEPRPAAPSSSKGRVQSDSPTSPTIRDAHPRCDLGKPSRSDDTVVVFLIRAPGLPKTHYVPVERRIDAAAQTAPIKATLTELTRGTTPRERQAGCLSYFDSTKPGALRGVALEGDELTIDLRADAMFALGATTATSNLLEQLTRTVFRFPQVNSIRLELDGSCKRFGDAIQSLRCETITRDEP